jgi:hypothetical protein
MFEEDGAEQATRTGQSEGVVHSRAGNENADEQLIRERENRHTCAGEETAVAAGVLFSTVDVVGPAWQWHRMWKKPPYLYSLPGVCRTRFECVPTTVAASWRQTIRSK